jgi:hypothetical protein
MRARLTWLIIPVAVGGLTATAESQSPAGKPAAQAAQAVARDKAVREIADAIDRHLAAGWRAAGVTPAAASDDAEFLRRVYLDLAGRIPSVTEARQFLADKDKDSRRRLIERLLHGQRYVHHFGLLWRQWWLPETLANPELQFFGVQFDAWIRLRLGQYVSYDQIVHELITAPVSTGMGGGDGFLALQIYGNQSTPDPLAFYAVRGSKPDDVAAAVSRSFLGVKLECAQCHDHPFADWRREQFWGLAAFFAGMPRGIGPNQVFVSGGRMPTPPQEDSSVRQIKIPGTEKIGRPARRRQAEMERGRQPAPRPRRLAHHEGESVLRPRCGQPAVGLFLRHRSRRSRGRTGQQPESRESSGAARRVGHIVRGTQVRPEDPHRRHHE